MTIIKYKQGNDYCFVQKNNNISYFLVKKNMKYYYYEKYFTTNYNKTYEIICRLFKTKILEIEKIEIDSYEVIYKMCKFLFLKNKNENHYCLISETFGNQNYISFQIYKNNKIIDKYQGVKYSASFLVAYFDYKMSTMFPNNEEFLINFKDTKYNIKQSENVISLLTEKELKKYERYCRYLFYFYIKFQYKDLYINFDSITKKDIKKYLIKTYEYYDKIFGDLFEKIILRLINKKEIIKNNLNQFYTYFKYYFPFINFLYYLKNNNIKNNKILMHSCIFSLKHIKNFLNTDNSYYINDNVIMREKMLLFIDKNITNEDIELFMIDNEKTKIKKAKRTFKTFL
jgi:hypothetical protein